MAQYPKEIYKSGASLVIWSDEELLAKRRLGYTELADGSDAVAPPPPEPKGKNYPGEMYKDGGYIVVWSPEERMAKQRDGWSDEKPVAVDLPAPEPELLATPPAPAPAPVKPPTRFAPKVPQQPPIPTVAAPTFDPTKSE